jgi:hypothetical protein
MQATAFPAKTRSSNCVVGQMTADKDDNLDDKMAPINSFNGRALEHRLHYGVRIVIMSSSSKH